MNKVYIIYNDAFQSRLINLGDDIKEYQIDNLYFYLNGQDWYLRVSEARICEYDKYYQKIKLELSHYQILNDDCFYEKHLYIYDNDCGFNCYTMIKNDHFIIADHPKATYRLSNPHFKQAFLYYHDGIIESNIDDIFINHNRYHGEKIKSYDYLECLGLRLFFHHRFIYINTFYLNIDKPYLPKCDDYFYPDLINNHQKMTLNKPRNKDIDNPKPILKEIKKRSFPSLIEQIGQAFTMSLAMCMIAFFNFYINLKNGRSVIDILPYVLLPVVMLISVTTWPIVIRKLAKRKDLKALKISHKEYLLDVKKYCQNEYHRQLENIKYQNQNYFTYDSFIKLSFDKRLFYQNKRSLDFLEVSIGRYNHKISYDLISVKGLKEVVEPFSLIKDKPLFIDLSKLKKLIIIEKRKSNYYFIKYLLLQIASMKNYEDLLLVFYKKPDEIQNCDFIPHSFYQRRPCVFEDENQMLELNKIKDKKVIVFAFDNIKCQNINNEFAYIFYSHELNDELEYDGIIKVNNGEGNLYKDNEDISFKYQIEEVDFNHAYLKLARYLKFDDESVQMRFKDLFGVNYNILNSHLSSHHGLRANFALYDQKYILDLHERGSGPHGLIGGTTGSGKSELIISMLLSLCLRYSPEYLNIIIIDYKGAGICQSLSYQGRLLPHIIASINNLEDENFLRLIIALKCECTKRQERLNNLSNKLSQAIMNIDEYNDKSVDDKLARLLIVVDEFAELKKSHPDQMKELVSLSRIGRSLGLHLILATQKPSACIDDEIWSNSRFKIALKVQDERDSKELIDKELAAYLSRPGDFYLKVDQNLYQGRAIYSKNVVQDNLYEVAIVDFKGQKLVSNNHDKDFFSELMYYNQKLVELYSTIKIQEFMQMKPKAKRVDELLGDYQYKRSNKEMIMGEIDDYQNQHQDILSCPINCGHILIVTKRDDEIKLLLENLEVYSSQIIYIGSKEFTHIKISDCLKYWDDDLAYLFNSLSYKNDKKELLIIIEDLNVFMNLDSQIKDTFYHLLATSNITNVYFIALVKSVLNLPYRLIINFEHIFAIELKDKNELMMLFGGTHEVKEGYYYNERLIPYIPCKISDYRGQTCDMASYINKIPDRIKSEIKTDSYLIGYDIKLRIPIYLQKHQKVLIIAKKSKTINKLKAIFDLPSITYASIDETIDIKEYEVVIWISKGLIHQHRIFHHQKLDLNPDEALMIEDDRELKLRFIDYE